ncbi:tRNA (uridine(34)/cytosine(34)/5-carboxymethylaminomethyluridine(34)-2'-O)-methyltransferase TrmL [Salinispirillum sp. LH 10-3-1]|uniref:tRNA (cytidine(34)-2'-O)-methyltransferase n=1 Tax=Salinispirillum sp. LH 10-3-1 TaxID=2952525 RepID=A0AB38YI52_9GAMM
MFNLVLFEPEIPPNTGNIIRLAANTGCHLHLIEPLGFAMEDRALRRAGLDYHEWARVQVHANYEAFLQTAQPERLWALTTKGKASFFDGEYQVGDYFILGPESRGLPTELLESLAPEQRCRLPMRADSRSLNLSNTAAIVVYEVWRQLGFPGGQ